MSEQLEKRVEVLEHQMAAIVAGRPCTAAPTAPATQAPAVGTKCGSCGAEIPGYSGGPLLCPDCVGATGPKKTSPEDDGA